MTAQAIGSRPLRFLMLNDLGDLGMSAARVICIEDEPDMIDLMRLLLTRKGFEFIGARGGAEGLRLIASQKPDLILLDLMMPDMDGWEVYRRLKTDEATAQIPVIVVTARARTQEQLEALREARVDDYIVKPFGPGQLVTSIQRVLDLNRVQR